MVSFSNAKLEESRKVEYKLRERKVRIIDFKEQGLEMLTVKRKPTFLASKIEKKAGCRGLADKVLDSGDRVCGF